VAAPRPISGTPRHANAPRPRPGGGGNTGCAGWPQFRSGGRGALTRAALSMGGRTAIEVKCIDMHGVTRTGTAHRSGVARSIAESGAWSGQGHAVRPRCPMCQAHGQCHTGTTIAINPWYTLGTEMCVSRPKTDCALSTGHVHGGAPREEGAQRAGTRASRWLWRDATPT
jgi:hypothetical protein